MNRQWIIQGDGLWLTACLVLFLGSGPAAALTAVETVTVRDDNGAGVNAFFTVDFENNYLPNVVLRENGAASFEALKAQAVAARSFTYYKIGSGATFIKNSQADQVYSTGGIRSNPGGRWNQAVRETEGEYLSFNNITTASFYVAGAIPTSSTGIAGPGDSDPTDTEKWVTYTRADNLVGKNNLGTELGFNGTTSNPFYPNRGAMSQNGADFLSDAGTHYLDILKFYYGGDIQLGMVTQLPSHTPFATKTLAGFERNNDTFNRSLTFAGQTRNLGAGTAADRSTAFATTPGGASQRLTFNHDESADLSDGTRDGFFSRHLSGAANTQRLTNLTSGSITTPAGDPSGNLVMDSIGTLGFWLLAESPFENVDLQVSIAIDDFGSTSILGGTTEQASFLDVLADGNWHKYEWALDSAQWASAFGAAGDGLVGPRFTLDSILFRGFDDAVVYLDDVFFNPTGVVPEPSSLVVVLLSFAAVLRRGRVTKDPSA